MGDLRRLIAFDLDGTLVDSRRDLARAVNQLVGELGGAPFPEEVVGDMVGEGASTLVSRALTAAGLGQPRGALERFLAIYDSRLVDNTYVYEGIAEVVRDARRHARLAVLTNKPGRATERLLTALDLRDSFDEVIGGDGPLPRKPDPASLLDLMRRAGASPSTTLLIGDSVIDYETAERAGVRCCLAAYGFGYRRFPIGRLPVPEWIAHEPMGLAAILERFITGE
jgi:phosphoglycolate phosphatase